MKKLIIRTPSGNSAIYCGAGAFAARAGQLSERRLFVVTDSNVFALYSDVINEYFGSCPVHVMPAGERSKNQRRLFSILADMSKSGITRSYTLVAMGKDTDWEVHMLGQAVGAHTDATHGMTLAAVSMAYYRYIMPYGLVKFRRYAVNVWGVDPEGKTDEAVAAEGLDRMEAWMKSLGLVMNLTDLGVKEDMIDGLVKSTLVMEGGYKVLTPEEIARIFRASL